MTVVVVTGTGTGIGKTVVTSAIAVRAQGKRVAVVKPAQTGVLPGEPGDLAEVQRVAGEITTCELARYPDPLAPVTAARRVGCRPMSTRKIAWAVEELAGRHDLVLVEGAGGLLVRYDGDGGTLADVAMSLSAPVLVVAHAGLGVLNEAALTVEALRARQLRCMGIVIGSWPEVPGLAERCNIADLPAVTGVPLLGALPASSGVLAAAAFDDMARRGLAPQLGGEWDAAAFAERWNTAGVGQCC